MTTLELCKIWGKVAINSFGGPAGQIAVIHKLVVEDKKVISEDKFLHALNFCMLLPGPEAQQLATYMGWLMGKWKGGLIAGCLFILPGFLSILLLSYLYVLYLDLTLVQGLFYGIKPAIIAIVFNALFKISTKSLKTIHHKIFACLAFFMLFFLNISFPLIIIIAAMYGIFYSQFTPMKDQEIQRSRPPLKKTLSTLISWLFVWFFPVGIVILTLGSKHHFQSINFFFSKMSLVTFGGAYAALNYVAQQAVDHYGWLKSGEMLDGLALAETTPGPLIQVVQYVGFLAAYRNPGGMHPHISALIGSILTTWMTFAPCFLFIFTFAPYVEFIQGNKKLSSALSFISSAVVGVIANLSIWFVMHTIFNKVIKWKFGVLTLSLPVLSSIDFYAVFIFIIASLMQLYFKKGLFTIMGTSIFLGVIHQII